jgi:hypothetical protein
MTKFRDDDSVAMLGEYSNAYMVVSNRPECDENYDSAEKEWLGRASMSKHHRFLVTKDLHWQWFNVLVFGMVCEKDPSGASLRKAIEQLENMIKAARKFARNARKFLKWSTNIGFFFHVYPHTSTNSLHMHIVDLEFVGPTFHYMAYKNITAEAILEALRAEMNGKLVPGAALRYDEKDVELPKGEKIKSQLLKLHPIMNDAAGFQLVRKTLRSWGGAEAMRQELISERFLATESLQLSHGANPLNVFARLAYLENERTNVRNFVFGPERSSRMDNTMSNTMTITMSNTMSNTTATIGNTTTTMGNTMSNSTSELVTPG